MSSTDRAHAAGRLLLGDPLPDKGTAFSRQERQTLGIDGLTWTPAYQEDQP